MNLIRLALKNIRGTGFRSLAIFLAVMGVSGFLLATTIIISGAQYSLNSGLKRLGADLLVVPAGAEDNVELALLMGRPTNVWMPKNNLNLVAGIPYVAVVSPQSFIASLYGASCCSASEMFIVVYDPDTDFTVTPWLEKNLGRGLTKGEAIGGSYVFVPPGQTYIRIYGYDVTLAGNLNPTGTGLDQTLFVTAETAKAIAVSSYTTAIQPLLFDPEQISAIMVKVEPGASAHQVALSIMLDTTGLVPIESPDLFGAFRNQMNGLLYGFLAITVIIWFIAAVLCGIIFSMAANERRREMAVLHAVGARRSFIFMSLLTEAGLLAVSGAVVGISSVALVIYIFKDYIAGTLKMPFLFPSFSSFLGMFVAGLVLSMLTVLISALFPALRLSRQELAIAMRE